LSILLRHQISFYINPLFFCSSPFERTAEETNEIYDVLTTLEDFNNLFSQKEKENKRLIKEYCGYAQIETCTNKNTPSKIEFKIIKIEIFTNLKI